MTYLRETRQFRFALFYSLLFYCFIYLFFLSFIVFPENGLLRLFLPRKCRKSRGREDDEREPGPSNPEVCKCAVFCCCWCRHRVIVIIVVVVVVFNAFVSPSALWTNIRPERYPVIQPVTLIGLTSDSNVPTAV